MRPGTARVPRCARDSGGIAEGSDDMLLGFAGHSLRRHRNVAAGILERGAQRQRAGKECVVTRANRTSEEGRRHGGLRGVWLGVALLACCGGLHAQQAASSRGSLEVAKAPAKANTSELERENTERVAASPQQIREVLVRDPGLLVE